MATGFLARILGQKTMAESSPVVIASNQTAIPVAVQGDHAEVTARQLDPEQQAFEQENFDNIEQIKQAIFKSQSLIPTSPGQVVVPGRLQVEFATGIGATLTPVAYIDCANYSWITFQVSVVGTATAFQPQFSHDGTTWVNTVYQNAASVNTTTPIITTSTTVGLYQCAVAARYFRLAISGTTAGVCRGTVEARAFAPPVLNIGAAGVVAGAKTNNAAVPAATNLGVLPAVANRLGPTFTETFQTALSVELNSALRSATVRETAPYPLTDRAAFGTSLNTRGELLVDMTVVVRQLEELDLQAQLTNQMQMLALEPASAGRYGVEFR